MRRIPDYYHEYPNGAICPECGEWCKVVANQNEFDYAGTHCTYGRGGVHYPENWGEAISECCEAPISWEDANDVYQILL